MQSLIDHHYRIRVSIGPRMMLREIDSPIRRDWEDPIVCDAIRNMLAGLPAIPPKGPIEGIKPRTRWSFDRWRRPQSTAQPAWPAASQALRLNNSDSPAPAYFRSSNK